MLFIDCWPIDLVSLEFRISLFQPLGCYNEGQDESNPATSKIEIRVTVANLYKKLEPALKLWS